MKVLPIGIQSFKKLRENDFLYIDKTQYVYQLTQEAGYFFLSRPRRFGKSLLVSTLKELFEGNRNVFKDLWIEKQWDWEVKHPIVYIPFASLNYQDLGLEQALVQHLKEIAEQYQANVKYEGLKDIFKNLLVQLHQKYNRVVILVDEYDKPIIDYLGNEIEQAKANQQTMKTFYSVLKDADEHIRFLFITGISKFSKVSIFSDLNNLKDLTFSPQHQNLVGYTQAEIVEYFPEYLQKLAENSNKTILETLEKIKHWYNGYSWGGAERLYNPFGVLNLFSEQQFRNYWFATATPTFLIDLLRDKVLYDVENIKVSPSFFDTFEVSQDLKLEPLLFQTGYLTVKEETKRGLYILGYPNKEVKEAFLDYLVEGFSQYDKNRVRPLVFDLEDAFQDNDLETVIRLLNRMLKDLPYQLHEKTEKFYHAVVHLVFYYLGIYIQSEVCTSDGRADAIVETDTHIYCLEFKFDESATVALEQIQVKNYLEKFGQRSQKLVGIGINFSSEQKKISEWEILEI